MVFQYSLASFAPSLPPGALALVAQPWTLVKNRPRFLSEVSVVCTRDTVSVTKTVARPVARQSTATLSQTMAGPIRATVVAVADTMAAAESARVLVEVARDCPAPWQAQRATVVRLSNRASGEIGRAHV